MTAGQIVGFTRFRQRRDLHPFFPGHARLERVDGVAEFLDKGVDDFLVNEEHLEGRAALAVVGQGSQNAFLHRLVQVRILQDDPGVFGFQSEHAAQAMRLRMLLLEDIGDPAAADEG